MIIGYWAYTISELILKLVKIKARYVGNNNYIARNFIRENPNFFSRIFATISMKVTY